MALAKTGVPEKRVTQKPSAAARKLGSILEELGIPTDLDRNTRMDLFDPKDGNTRGMKWKPKREDLDKEVKVFVDRGPIRVFRNGKRIRNNVVNAVEMGPWYCVPRAKPRQNKRMYGERWKGPNEECNRAKGIVVSLFEPGTFRVHRFVMKAGDTVADLKQAIGKRLGEASVSREFIRQWVAKAKSEGVDKQLSEILPHWRQSMQFIARQSRSVTYKTHYHMTKLFLEGMQSQPQTKGWGRTAVEIGSIVKKDFEGTTFTGKVVAVDMEKRRAGSRIKKLYHVVYSDGDEEDLYESEIKPLLVKQPVAPKRKGGRAVVIDTNDRKIPKETKRQQIVAPRRFPLWFLIKAANANRAKARYNKALAFMREYVKECYRHFKDRPRQTVVGLRRTRKETVDLVKLRILTTNQEGQVLEVSSDLSLEKAGNLGLLNPALHFVVEL